MENKKEKLLKRFLEHKYVLFGETKIENCGSDGVVIYYKSNIRNKKESLCKLDIEKFKNYLYILSVNDNMDCFENLDKFYGLNNITKSGDYYDVDILKNKITFTNRKDCNILENIDDLIEILKEIKKSL